MWGLEDFGTLEVSRLAGSLGRDLEVLTIRTHLVVVAVVAMSYLVIIVIIHYLLSTPTMFATSSECKAEKLSRVMNESLKYIRI